MGRDPLGVRAATGGRAMTEGARRMPATPAVVIRQGTPNDARTVSAFAARQFIATFAPDNDATQLARYVSEAFGEVQQRRELEDAECTYLLVTIDDTLVAQALLRHGATHGSVSPAAQSEIQRFYVDGDFHGRGTAAELMRTCLELVRARGADAVWLGVWERNLRAIRFYEKCGFTEVGRTVFHMGDDIQHDLVMSRLTDPGAGVSYASA